jgi:hypothetical protein
MLKLPLVFWVPPLTHEGGQVFHHFISKYSSRIVGLKYAWHHLVLKENITKFGGLVNGAI